INSGPSRHGSMALTTVTSSPGTSFRHFARTLSPAMYSCVVAGCPSGPQPTRSSFFGAAANAGPPSEARASSTSSHLRRIIATTSGSNHTSRQPAHYRSRRGDPPATFSGKRFVRGVFCGGERTLPGWWEEWHEHGALQRVVAEGNVDGGSRRARLVVRAGG